MVSKALLKNIRQLHQKKFRNEQRLFLVEGEKVVNELLESDFITKQVFATPEWLSANRKPVKNFELIEVTKKELAELSLQEAPNKVIGVAVMKEYGAMSPEPDLKYLALDSIRDPGNMGTILRIADWFGITGIFCGTGTVDIYNPKVVQASMGSLFRIPTIEVDLAAFLKDIDPSIDIFGALLEGDSIYQSPSKKGWILTIGNESTGISEEVESVIRKKISIPAYGQSGERAESLNAAVATAVICAELCRRE
jgi:RNA methyltransferase, TrmH family